MKDLELNIVEVPITDLVPYAKNANIHSNTQIDQIANSISEFGFIDPVGIWENEQGQPEIVEGHGRVLAAKRLGYKELPVIYLNALTDEQRRAYTHVHNQLTRNSEFDEGLLLAEIEALDFDWEALGFDVTEDKDPEQVVEDEVPAIPIITKAKPGDIYELGYHRLMCGDSTNRRDVEMLMGGVLADMALTDPPYNVDIASRGKEVMKIQNDAMGNGQFLEFLNAAFSAMEDAMKPGAAFYIWHASRTQREFETALNNNGLEVRQQLIWDKTPFVMGRQDYQWKHEPCFYGWKDGAAHYFIDDRTKATVFEDAKPNIRAMKKDEMAALLEEIYADKVSTTVMCEPKPSVADLHPTMKPVKLLARQIANSSKPDWVVLDLFGGSGSTLMACEQLGRRCFMMEYDPHYCNVIIQRWEDFTGEQAIRVQDGQA